MWELTGETESFSEILTGLEPDPRHQPIGALGHLTQLRDGFSGKWPEQEEGTGAQGVKGQEKVVHLSWSGTA